VYLRTEYRWKNGRQVAVKIYRRKPKPKSLRDLRPNIDRHPETGKLIPSPSNVYAAYPGKGFCRTVCVKKAVTYKKDYRGNKIKQSERVISKRPITGWHVCKNAK
jgi:hypothetical protein